MRAEVKFTNFVIEHNLPIAVSDHLTPLVQDVFSDSQIAKKYASRRTKTTSVLNVAIAPHFRSMFNKINVQVFTFNLSLCFVRFFD